DVERVIRQHVMRYRRFSVTTVTLFGALSRCWRGRLTSSTLTDNGRACGRRNLRPAGWTRGLKGVDFPGCGSGAPLVERPSGTISRSDQGPGSAVFGLISVSLSQICRTLVTMVAWSYLILECRLGPKSPRPDRKYDHPFYPIEEVIALARRS